MTSSQGPSHARFARAVGPVATAAALLGLVFALYSTYDYAVHLDRQVHAVHCSFVPGAPISEDADNACKAALFSPYSALFRSAYWGGIPISLFAVGTFSFFAGFGLYLSLARERAKRFAWLFLGTTGLLPLVASLFMAVISATKLGTFCKLCVGVYVASTVLAVASVLSLTMFRRAKLPPAPTDGSQRLDLSQLGPRESVGLPFAWLATLGLCSLSPAMLYAASLPDYKAKLTTCGTLTTKTESHGALLKLKTERATRPVLLFEDPLCPTCKSFHDRLKIEGALEQLDVTLALFPLDTECNWMLDRSLHPGACLLSRAILCSAQATGDGRAMLEWAFQNQDELREAGRAGVASVKKKVEARFGPELVACVDDKRTAVKLNQHLHFASKNRIPISTPQMFLGDTRICEEDTDLGLRYTLTQLAPEVLR
ncbi:MAG: hypothetical protein IPG50_37055 [Myxococcales bacterium]|nr:hypothetical protein [Myxococcales bacterium]